MSIYPEVDTKDELEQSPGSQVQKSDVPKYETEPGPQEKRKCRDIFWLLLFIVFWIGMFVIAGLAISQGNLDRLRYGNDSIGNLCGVKNDGGLDHTDAPYQYVFNPTTTNSFKKCVSKCPDQNFQPICPYGVQPPAGLQNVSLADIKDIIVLINNGTFDNCTLTYKSAMILNRCVPDIAAFVNFQNATGYNGTISQQAQSVGTEIFSDLYNSWKIILICSAIALVLSFIWMVVMQYFSSFMVWATVILVNLASIAFTALIWNYWNKVRVDNGPIQDYNISSASNNEKVLLAVSIIASVLTFFLIIFTITMRSRINLAVAVIGEASKAIKKMPTIIFFPILKYILLTLLTAWTVYIWACLVTSGYKVSDTLAAQINNQTQVTFSQNEAFQYLTIYYALGYFWSFQFIIAIAQTTIAGAIASWYWARDKNAVPSAAISRSFYRTLRYHLGSLALGSLIIAIIETIRAIVYYFQQQLSKQKASKAAQCCLACVQCCLACFERFMKFINKNAYIEIAIYGYSFCGAAKVAFSLLFRNAIRVAVLGSVADFLFFLGKIMITAITAIIGSSLLQNPEQLPNGDEINIGRFWSISLIIIIILSYLIASSFMAVYDMAISTIFLCFCEDSERNDGSAAKPYYMEESLRKFVDSKTKEQPKV